MDYGNKSFYESLLGTQRRVPIVLRVRGVIHEWLESQCLPMGPARTPKQLLLIGLHKDSNWVEDTEVYYSIGKYNPGMPQESGDDFMLKKSRCEISDG